jgi:hypothetical protein
MQYLVNSIVDYTQFFRQTLTNLGFDVHGVWNSFVPPYNNQTGWTVRLPDIDFRPNTLLVMHFQDFVTNQEGKILELEQVEQKYQQHANQVLVVHWPHNLQRYYQGPINLVEFDVHEYVILRNLHSRWTEWQHMLSVPKTTAWQCLNGRTCPHRFRVKEILQSWGHGTLSYHGEVLLSKWDYNTYRGTENEDNFMRLLDVYGSCAVNIVTETQYDTAPGLVTEKTFMALLAEQIPIVIGYAGIVQDCVELGFDMFTDLVDVSYDHAPNDQRIQQALELNQDLIMGRIDLAPYRGRLRQQREFLLDDYPTMMELRFVRDCEQLAKKSNLQ